MTDMLRLLLIWLGTVSLLTLLLFGWDKLMAKLGRRRIPERTLLAAAFFGGAAGGLLGMRLFRHELRKGRFRVWLPVLALLQAGLALWAAYIHQ